MASSRAATTAAAGSSGGARKDKDRSYRHVFKGLVLVNTLLDYDTNRFADRQAAVKFAQKLLDLGQVDQIALCDMFSWDAYVSLVFIRKEKSKKSSYVCFINMPVLPILYPFNVNCIFYFLKGLMINQV